MVINLDVPTLIYLPKLNKNLCHINFPHVATGDCVTCAIFLQGIIICDESGKVLWHMNTATENAWSDLVATKKLQKSWNRHMTRYRMQYSATLCCRAIVQSYKIGSNAQALTSMLYCYHDSLLSWCGQYNSPNCSKKIKKHYKRIIPQLWQISHDHSALESRQM